MEMGVTKQIEKLKLIEYGIFCCVISTGKKDKCDHASGLSRKDRREAGLPISACR